MHFFVVGEWLKLYLHENINCTVPFDMFFLHGSNTCLVVSVSRITSVVESRTTKSALRYLLMKMIQMSIRLLKSNPKYNVLTLKDHMF